MKLFLYEHITASVADQSSSLFIEGRAMRDALAGDLRMIDGVELIEYDAVFGFDGCLERADAAWVIAPEFDGILFDFAQRVERSGKRLIGPTSEAIRLTSDKRRLAKHWQSHGVPTPEILDGEPDEYPVVVKPFDGCGSQGTRRVNCREEFGDISDKFVIQPFVPGSPSSVAFINGHQLWPMTQQIDVANGFAYGGGETIMTCESADTLGALAQRAVECIPGLMGYFGVDLILGSDESTSVALEINPRLTTSYVGLRRLTQENLAKRVLFPEQFQSPVVWRTIDGLRFDTMGTIEELSPKGFWQTI